MGGLIVLIVVSYVAGLLTMIFWSNIHSYLIVRNEVDVQMPLNWRVLFGSKLYFKWLDNEIRREEIANTRRA